MTTDFVINSAKLLLFGLLYDINGLENMRDFWKTLPFASHQRRDVRLKI